jgi:hypothetical protein
MSLAAGFLQDIVLAACAATGFGKIGRAHV